MKTKRTIMTLVVLAVAAVLVSGCTLESIGIRLGVLAENVQTEADRLLGQGKIMRADAVAEIGKVVRYIEGLQTAYVENKVDAEIVGEKLSVLWANRTQMQTLLGRLAELIAAGQPVTTRDGRTVSVGEMESFARSKLLAFDILTAEIATWEEVQAVYAEAAAQALAELNRHQQNMTSLNSTIALLDAKLALLDVLNRQAKQLGPQSVPQLDGEQHQMQGALDAIEREIRIAKERKNLPQPDKLSAEQTAALESLVGASDSLLDELRERAGQ